MSSHQIVSKLPFFHIDSERPTLDCTKPQKLWQQKTPKHLNRLSGLTTPKFLVESNRLMSLYYFPAVRGDNVQESLHSRSEHHPPTVDIGLENLTWSCRNKRVRGSTTLLPEQNLPPSISNDTPLAGGFSASGRCWSLAKNEGSCQASCENAGDNLDDSTHHIFLSSPTFSTVSINSTHCDSGITLQDVQHYPDSFVNEGLSPFPSEVNAHQYSRPMDCTITPWTQTIDAPWNKSLESIPLPSVGNFRDLTKNNERIRENHPTCCTRPSSNTSFPKSDKGLARKAGGNCYADRPRAKLVNRTKRISKGSPIQQSTISSNAKSSPSMCPHCPKLFLTKSALNKHVSVAHTRPFSCTFRLYGCAGTFGSKNEWKRHVSSQHLRLAIWRCDIGSCVPQRSLSKSQDVTDEGDGKILDLVCNDFNRKDLFIQHLRRMHGPSALASQAERDGFSASLEPISRRCLIRIRSPPAQSICGYCSLDLMGRPIAFKGSGSWEARMEHVGRHLESGHGETKRWQEDIYLKAWMVSEGLVQQLDRDGWELVVLCAEMENSKGLRR